jgi:hypothetical protein
MARAIFMVHRDTHEVRLFLDSYKPSLNYGLEFTFENVRDSFNSDCAAVLAF